MNDVINSLEQNNQKLNSVGQESDVVSTLHQGAHSCPSGNQHPY